MSFTAHIISTIRRKAQIVCTVDIIKESPYVLNEKLVFCHSFTCKRFVSLKNLPLFLLLAYFFNEMYNNTINLR